MTTENTITINLKTYQALKKEYLKAVSENKNIFIFEGNELLTSYAKYLLQYFELCLSPSLTGIKTTDNRG
jgi:hypothetical protein